MIASILQLWCQNSAAFACFDHLHKCKIDAILWPCTRAPVGNTGRMGIVAGYWRDTGPQTAIFNPGWGGVDAPRATCAPDRNLVRPMCSRFGIAVRPNRARPARAPV